MFKLQKKPSALKRGHPTLKTWTFTNFFLLLWVIFALPGSGSTDPIESGSNPDPDPQPCFKPFKRLNSYIFSFYGGWGPVPTSLDPDPDSQSGSGSVDLIEILLSNSLFSHLSSLEKDRKYLEADLTPNTTKEKHKRSAVVETSLSISERILLDSVKVSGTCTKNCIKIFVYVFLKKILKTPNQCWGSVTFLVQIRIRIPGSVPLANFDQKKDGLFPSLVSWMSWCNKFSMHLFIQYKLDKV